MENQLHRLEQVIHQLKNYSEVLATLLIDTYDMSGDHPEKIKIAERHIERLMYIEGSTRRAVSEVSIRLRGFENSVNGRIGVLESVLEKKLSEINDRISAIGENFTPTRCIYAEDRDAIDGSIAKLILTGGPSYQAQESGKREFLEEMSDWLADADEIILMDPYLFKRSRATHRFTGKNLEENMPMYTIAEDTKYVDRLLKVIGPKKRNVIFFYDSDKKNHLTPAVVKIFTERIANVSTKPSYYASDAIHDRVWLRKRSGKWEAQVIGTSLDGIGNRPTYVMAMTSEDVAEYMKYIKYLKKNSVYSMEEPIIKKAKTNKKIQST